MKFSRLRLLGFKSFVDGIEFPIERGLTGVVGPNGCGKSNLVEALRWVMGESSYKSMRASGMDDVIFSGSAGRPARNTAEVGVVLDNTARRAPSGFNDADVLEITRRIEREAGSVYRINGREVRARDVQLLFADASTGARSPALVRQGQIGELISAKPAARRQILEEAAGISGLHSRRHEAELRLRAAEQNLERLEDVLVQLETQLESLKRQARQATRYRNLSSEIRKAEATVLFVRLLGARAGVREADEQLKESSGSVAGLAETQAKAAREQALAAHEIPKLRDAEAEAAAGLQTLVLARNEIDNEEARIRKRIEDLTGRLEQLASDLAREQSMIEENGSAIARLDEEEGRLRAEAEASGEKAESAQTAVVEAEDVLQQSETELQSRTADAAQEQAARAQLTRTVGDAETRIGRLEAQIADVDREYADLETRQSEAADLRQARARAEAAEEALLAADTGTREAEEKTGAARAAEEGLRAPLRDAEQAFQKAATEAETLARVLQLDHGQLWPPVVDQLTVARGFELALGAALGDDLDAPADANAPVHWSPVGSGDDDPPLPAGILSLGGHVVGPSVLTRRLRQIGLVDREEGAARQAELRPGQRLVSKEGDLWRWDGLTASADAPTAATQRLEQKNRLAELEKLATGLKADLDTAREAHKAASAETARCQELETGARNRWREAQSAAARERQALQVAEQKAAKTATRLSALAEARVRLASSLEEAQGVAAEARTALADLPPPDRLDQEIAGLRSKVAEQRAALAEARAASRSLAREGELRDARLAAIASERESWNRRAANAGEQIATLEGRIREAGAERASLEGTPDRLAERRRALLSKIADMETLRGKAGDALARGETRLREADVAAKQANEALSGGREAQVRAEERLEAARERLKETEARIREVLDCRPEATAGLAGIDPEAPIPELDAVERKLERLKAERERLGGVNLRADDEAREVAERRDALVSEREDLIEAIKRLRQAIYSLNREARERLLEAFDTVNGHFQQLFTHLFGGGTAELQLVDAEDPLEAGLEFMARPPGKRPQTMTLLSGGEQALTAIALIFAVFLTNPAPICVLDEVDAPLDDANVERFCNLLDEMTRRTETRFMAITHNPITMARMDRLFGVTMAERGVSQLVSVDLETAERFQEAG